MKLIIDAPDEIVEKGFEGPLTDEERQILIRAIGNGTLYKERPRGEWSDLSVDGRHTGWIYCTVCGHEPPNESNLRTDFCPNCGADMRNKEDVFTRKEELTEEESEWLIDFITKEGGAE